MAEPKTYDGFTIEALSMPATYEADGELATLARHLATTQYEELGRGRVGMGDLKREFLSGKHADKVAAALAEREAKKSKTKKKASAGAKAASAIVAPSGYQVEVGDKEILVRGPFDDDLNQRIKRAGGYWDGASYANRKLWSVPATKGESLKRIMANWSKGRVDKSLERDRAEVERWLGYIEDKAPDYLYQKGVDKLRELRVSRWPELQERLDKAVASVTAKQAKDKEAASQRRFESELAEFGQSRQKASSKPRQLFPLSALPPLNKPVRLGSKVVVFESAGKSFRISDDAPSLHGSHLLGYEGSLGCYAYYRPATEEETAAYHAKEQKQQEESERKAAAKRDLRALSDRFMSTGVRPEGSRALSGERILDTQNIYGGGDWWVIDGDRIWYVRNNGADGDAWDQNNIQTGGAGAIGWSLPAEPSVINELRRLDRILSVS